MNGPIAQQIGLAIWGNAYLQKMPLDSFWPDASFFAFCREVRFGRWDWNRQAASIFAENPLDWLAQRRLDTAGFRLRVLPRKRPDIGDRTSAGFVGGGRRWLIEAIGTSGEGHLWQDQWDVSDQNAPDQRIWSVTYWRIEESLSPLADRTVDAVSADLAEALAAIADFADRRGSGFASNFRAGLSALHGEAVGLWHKDLAPGGVLSPEAKRLIDACQAAWVFGGMGSWNDGAYWGESAEEGDRLSDRAFDLINEGLAVGANSTFASARAGA